MANVLTSGASLSAPISRPSLLARFWRAIIETQQRRAERVVAQYLASTGYRLTDDVERQIERRLFKSHLNW